MIVGGLLVGTFFTLFVVPTAYTLLARRERSAHAAEHPAVAAVAAPAE